MLMFIAMFAITSCGSGSATSEKSESDSTVVDSVEVAVDTAEVVEVDTTIVQ